MVYTASNPSLALLETLVHTFTLLPGIDYCMLKLENNLDSMQTKLLSELPNDWAASPAPDYLKSIGDEFIDQGKFLILKVPSAVLSLEWNYLLNPGHALFNKLKVYPKQKVIIDRRLIVKNK